MEKTDDSIPATKSPISGKLANEVMLIIKRNMSLFGQNLVFFAIKIRAFDIKFLSILFP